MLEVKTIARLPDRRSLMRFEKLFLNLHFDDVAEFCYNSAIKKGENPMPAIKSSAELRNNYNAVSQQAHEYREPIFITKNGKGDVAVMSIEYYEDLQGRLDLYGKIADGLDDIRTGNTMPFSEAMKKLRAGRKR